MNNFNRMTVGYAWTKSSEAFADLPFTASIKGRNFNYREASVVISELSDNLYQIGFKKDDKIAILSENRAEWGLCWLAVTTMGCVAVPIMTDFSAEQINNILKHSESKFIFVSEKLKKKIEHSDLIQNNSFILIDDNPVFDKKSGSESAIGDIAEISDPEDIASLIYTSGTTGSSKGVLLSHKNIMTNTCDSTLIGKFEIGDSMLSVLPLAHMYEFTQGFMLPMIEGANITYLGTKPSPTIMLKTIAKVRPHYILSVPLLIEKIYKNSVLQPISKNTVLKQIYKLPLFRKLLNRFIIGKKLLKTFGGRLKFFGMGGAPLSEKIERFLREAGFPYAIGYGLTETSPVLAGSGSFETVFRGIGPAFKSVKLRVSDKGEIQASGDSIMKGYFKDPERTAEVFTKDGWFKTGDLGNIDKKGTLFIKGRLKNMILGPAGENIYPEEIENEIKSHPVVAECIVLKHQTGLVARVFFDQEKLKLDMDELKLNWQIEKDIMIEYLRKSINKNLSNFSKLSQIIEQELPFELTPSLKVKRFLYTRNN